MRRCECGSRCWAAGTAGPVEATLGTGGPSDAAVNDRGCCCDDAYATEWGIREACVPRDGHRP